MTQLSDTQAVILSAASQRDDGAILPLPDALRIKVGAVTKVLGSLKATIDQAMHDAAKDFQAAFIIANLDPLRALPILRVPGTGREPELNEQQIDARRRPAHMGQGARCHGRAGAPPRPGPRSRRS